MAKIGEHSRKFFGVLLLGWITTLTVVAPRAQAVEINASVDRDKVEEGEAFVYTITVSSRDTVRLQDPQLPTLQGIAVIGSSVSSETRSQMQTTAQGASLVVEQVQRFNYQMAPQRVGRIRIGPSEVTVNGQSLRTPEVSLEVVPRGTLGARPRSATPPGSSPGSSPGNFPGGMASPFDAFDEAFNQLLRRRESALRTLPMRGEDFFIGVTLDKQSVYVGEKLIVSYYLYTNGQVTDIDTLSYPALEGFWKEDIEVATHLNFETVSVQGESYNRALLASYALFPLKDGDLAIDPYRAKVGLAGRGGKVTNTQQSEKRYVQVRPLPSPRPEPFLGVAGDYQAKSEMVDRQFYQGQPFQYRVRFDGDGNSKAISAPDLNLPAGFEIYNTTDEAQFFRNGRGYKCFDFFIVASEPGQFQIPPYEAHYFDPRTETYERLVTSPHDLRVLPSQSPVTAQAQPLAKSAQDQKEEESTSDLGMDGLPFLTSSSAWAKLPAPPPAVWWALYLLSFTVLGVRAHRAFGWGQRKKSFQSLVQRRVKDLQRAAHREDFRAVGSGAINTTSYLLGQMSGVGGGGERLDQLLSKAPPSLKRELGDELSRLMEKSQALSFAPLEALGDEKSRDQLKKFVEKVEKVWIRCLNLGFQEEELGLRS